MKFYFFLLIIVFLICFSIITYSAPVEITIEYGEETCIENWGCTEWSECSDGTQTRTCTDSNNCGTTVDKPEEIRSCSISPAPSPGGPGGPTITPDVTPSDTTTSPEPEPEIPPEPELVESPYIDLELTTVDEIEAGEPFEVNVTISSTIAFGTTIELLGKKQDVILGAGETKTLSFEVYAPETGGKYNLVAVTPNATGNKTINLDYKPLFLYVNPIGNQTYEIHLKNFDNSSTTELDIVKDNFQTVYFDIINGKTDYKINLTFSKPGKYVVNAKAMSGLNILDEDIRTFEILGEPQIDYGWLIIIVVLVIILMGTTLIFKEKFRKVD